MKLKIFIIILILLGLGFLYSTTFMTGIVKDDKIVGWCDYWNKSECKMFKEPISKNSSLVLEFRDFIDYNEYKGK